VTEEVSPQQPADLLTIVSLLIDEVAVQQIAESIGATRFASLHGAIDKALDLRFGGIAVATASLQQQH
jgi:hypothetical protein